MHRLLDNTPIEGKNSIYYADICIKSSSQERLQQNLMVTITTPQLISGTHPLRHYFECLSAIHIHCHFLGTIAHLPSPQVTSSISAYSIISGHVHSLYRLTFLSFTTSNPVPPVKWDEPRPDIFVHVPVADFECHHS